MQATLSHFDDTTPKTISVFFGLDVSSSNDKLDELELYKISKQYECFYISF